MSKPKLCPDCKSESDVITAKLLGYPRVGKWQVCRKHSLVFNNGEVISRRTLLALIKAVEPKFSVAEAANHLGVNRSTVSRLISTKKLGCYQIGSRKVVGQSHLEEYLNRVERKPKPLRVI